MKRRKHVYLLIISTIFFSCNEEEKGIMGYWSIEKYEADFEIRVNGFYLFDDYTCSLPVLSMEDRNTDKEKGTWSTSKESGSFLLHIQSTNTPLAGSYKVLNYREIEDPNTGGVLYKVDFVKGNLIMYCVKNSISTHRPEAL